jgi:truncated hemoglobin YjbI
MSNLFERIGGMNSADAAVKIFYRRVLGDKHIRHFFDAVDLDNPGAR